MPSTPSDNACFEGRPVALLWDQSLVWGLICLRTLREMGVPFHLLSAGDIVEGCLDSYRVLLVPGGWASHKIRDLGEAGRDSIRSFVRRGGSYFGFCGGAGLALSSPSALGLVPIERMELSERLPSASGEVWIQGVTDHPAWEGLPGEIPVSVWWPSQFQWHPLPRVLCLATYRATGEGFRVADLPASDMETKGMPWGEWERVYGINLNPARILGHPAILEVRLGKGKLILSYPHLETPDDTFGNRLFLNLLNYLDKTASAHVPKASLPVTRPIPGESSKPESEIPPLATCHPPPVTRHSEFAKPGTETVQCLVRMEKTARDLIDFGERHLFWNWRRPWLLGWKRGVRGLEYGTLAVMIQFLVETAEELSGSTVPIDPWLERVEKLEEDVNTFCRLAEYLLLEEKLASQTGNLTKLGSINKEIDELRTRLFGRNMNHGGLCRTIFDEMDRLLFQLLRLGC